MQRQFVPAFLLVTCMALHVAAANDVPVSSQAVVLLKPLVAPDPLPPLAPGTSDLQFNELFRLPVGPRGLEPTSKLLALEGHRVRISGYMVHQEIATPGLFILTPVPVSTEEASDGMADDLPPAQIFVHLPVSLQDFAVPHTGLRLMVEGTLQVGAQEERDGRISSIRLQMN